MLAVRGSDISIQPTAISVEEGRGLRRIFGIRSLRKNWPVGRKLTLFLFVSAVAFALPGLGYLYGLDLAGRKILFILTLAVGLWMTEAVPAFATALLIVGFQVFFLGTEQSPASDAALSKYTRAWSSPVIWLLMGGFFLSLATTLTGLDRLAFSHIVRWLGRNSRRLLLGFMSIAAILSMFMSNTATTALMLGLLGPTLAAPEQSAALRKSLLVGIPAAASIGGMATLIGSTPNAIAYSYLQQAGIEFGFLPWLAVGLPLVLVLIPATWALTVWFFNMPDVTLPLEQISEESIQQADQRQIRRRDRAVVVLVFLATAGLWATAPLHKLSVSVVSLIPIVALTVTGVVRSQDVRLLPWDTLLLIMGGMSLGESVIESGLAQFIVDRINVSANYPVIAFLVLGYVSVLFSTVMSNTAAAAILIPLGNALLPDQILFLTLVIALTSSIATALPVSTPPNAVAYASGYLEAKDFARTGLVLALAGPPMIVAVLYFFL